MNLTKGSVKVFKVGEVTHSEVKVYDKSKQSRS